MLQALADGCPLPAARAPAVQLLEAMPTRRDAVAALAAALRAPNAPAALAGLLQDAGPARLLYYLQVRFRGRRPHGMPDALTLMTGLTSVLRRKVTLQACENECVDRYADFPSRSAWPHIADAAQLAWALCIQPGAQILKPFMMAMPGHLQIMAAVLLPAQPPAPEDATEATPLQDAVSCDGCVAVLINAVDTLQRRGSSCESRQPAAACLPVLRRMCLGFL